LGGVNLYTVSLGRRRGSLARYAFEYLAFFLWALFKVSSLMKHRHYAVIDANNLPDFLVFAGAYARLRGAKIVFDMHEIAPEFFISKYQIHQNSMLVRFLRYVEKISFHFADHVITINQPIQDLLVNRGLPASKSTIIMNSVDEAFFTSFLDSSDSSDLTVSREQFVMMYHGTLTHLYGLDIALEAFGMVHNDMPGAEFWILGNGPEKGLLETLARKLGLASKVRFLGIVLPHEIPQWLKRCNIGVLATRQDAFLDLSFSSKLSEYIIMNKAVISSRLKTIRHYFSEQALAFFQPNSPSDLAKQMLSMYRDAARRIRLAERAKQEYPPICWDVMKARYLRLMEDLTGQSAAAPRHDHTYSHPSQMRVMSR
jgi:glycosyltransferase involved in cell wall biosynthesis